MDQTQTHADYVKHTLWVDCHRSRNLAQNIFTSLEVNMLKISIIATILTLLSFVATVYGDYCHLGPETSNDTSDCDVFTCNGFQYTVCCDGSGSKPHYDCSNNECSCQNKGLAVAIICVIVIIPIAVIIGICACCFCCTGCPLYGKCSAKKDDNVPLSAPPAQV